MNDPISITSERAKELHDKLISYANCNRCELTPQDAREILLLLETVPTFISVIHGR